ncbi:hypothetical protein [uncultured Actinomyces sp.]|uniref:hypothetical protein n=1 Tax=uncultured Actinomyces sp. TaxID=249061 RepID=UPI0028D169D3|nr:hypothetical protein [uncultured Actinomyces sp.]
MSERSTPENKADEMTLVQSEVQQQADTWLLRAIAKIGIGEQMSAPVIVPKTQKKPIRRAKKTQIPIYDSTPHHESSQIFDVPDVPSNFFADRSELPTLETSVFVEGELPIKVRIPEELHQQLILTENGITTYDTLDQRIKAHEFLVRYLDQYWDGLTVSNMEQLNNSDMPLSGEEDSKRVRRAIVGLQIEINREITRLKQIRASTRLGRDHSYEIDSPTA